MTNQDVSNALQSKVVVALVSRLVDAQVLQLPTGRVLPSSQCKAAATVAALDVLLGWGVRRAERHLTRSHTYQRDLPVEIPRQVSRRYCQVARPTSTASSSTATCNFLEKIVSRRRKAFLTLLF